MLKKYLSMAIIVAVIFSMLLFPTETGAESLPTVPDGSAYKVSANEIEPFKTGDIISLTLKITDIKAAGGLLGLDLDVVYDPMYLTPVKKTNGKPDVTSAASSIMAKYESSKWTATSRLDNEGTSEPTLVLKLFNDADPNAEEPEKEVAIKNDGELWFTIKFEAIKDAEASGNVIAYTEGASGTDGNTNGVQGQGIVVSVKGVATPAPTVSPTPIPTEEPTPVPKPENPGSLIFVSRPVKLYYEVGEKLDLTGLSVVIKDENGVKTPVAIEDCTITGAFDSDTVGEYPMTVRYETEDAIHSNIFTLTVRPKTVITMTGIGLATKPTKLYYEVGEELDLTGLSILVKYSNGTVDYVSEGLEVTGYDATALGVQRLTVSYAGSSTSFSVKVSPKAAITVTGIALTTKPTKLYYQRGETLDTTGLSVLVKYSNGTTVYISEGLEVTGYDATVSGAPQRLTVSYGGQSTGFSVHVL